MTINYTTLLGLAKPVTGTETGVWGDVVNDQITSLIEDAVANVASVNVSAGNVTLSTTSGSANQARCAIIIATGTPGTSRNIIAPSQSKFYIVINQSDASIVLKGAATTGVTLTTNTNALVAWNGTDFEIVSVSAPTASVDNEIVLFSGTSGKVIKRATTTGILKGTSGVISAAVSGTDYAPATSVSGILKGNGSGGFSTATAGTDYGKPDTASTWSASQRGTVTTDNDGSFDMNVTNNFKCTPTGTFTLTFTNITAGQSGFVLLINNSNYAITAAATTKVPSTLLATISATGTYLLSYWTDGTNVYVTNSGAMA